MGKFSHFLRGFKVNLSYLWFLAWYDRRYVSTDNSQVNCYRWKIVHVTLYMRYMSCSTIWIAGTSIFAFCIRHGYTLWAIKKTRHVYFCDNSGKYWPIFVIFFTAIYNNELRNKNLLKFSPRLKSVAALPCETWNVKCVDIQQGHYSIQNWL